MRANPRSLAERRTAASAQTTSRHCLSGSPFLDTACRGGIDETIDSPIWEAPWWSGDSVAQGWIRAAGAPRAVVSATRGDQAVHRAHGRHVTLDVSTVPLRIRQPVVAVVAPAIMLIETAVNGHTARFPRPPDPDPLQDRVGSAPDGRRRGSLR